MSAAVAAARARWQAAIDHRSQTFKAAGDARRARERAEQHAVECAEALEKRRGEQAYRDDAYRAALAMALRDGTDKPEPPPESSDLAAAERSADIAQDILEQARAIETTAFNRYGVAINSVEAAVAGVLASLADEDGKELAATRVKLFQIADKIRALDRVLVVGLRNGVPLNTETKEALDDVAALTEARFPPYAERAQAIYVEQWCALRDGLLADKPTADAAEPESDTAESADSDSDAAA